MNYTVKATNTSLNNDISKELIVQRVTIGVRKKGMFVTRGLLVLKNSWHSRGGWLTWEWGHCQIMGYHIMLAATLIALYQYIVHVWLSKCLLFACFSKWLFVAVSPFLLWPPAVPSLFHQKQIGLKFVFKEIVEVRRSQTVFTNSQNLKKKDFTI